MTKQQFAKRFEKSSPPIPVEFLCLIELYNWLYNLSVDVRGFVLRKNADLRPAALLAVQMKLEAYMKEQGVPRDLMVSELTEEAVRDALKPPTQAAGAG